MVEIVNFEQRESLFNQVMSEVRDAEIQQDRMRFRRNLERMGEIFAYEISKTMEYEPKEVVTPLGVKTVRVLKEQPVLATILRAGLPMHNGLLNMFDKADNAFIAAYRKYDKGNDFHINIEYCTAPRIEGKVLILADTMLATGASIEVAYEKLCEVGGMPLETHFVCPISSIYAVEYLKKHLPGKITLWTAAIDEELSAHSYIIPGLGDAGDLAYGGKL